MLKSFLPEFFLSGSILIQLIFNVKLVANFKFNYPLIHKEIFIQTLFVLICILFLFLNLKLEIQSANFLFITNSEILFIKLLITVFSLFTLIFFYTVFTVQKLSFFEFFSFFLLSCLSSLLMLSSNDFIIFYLCLELQSLCFYVLAGFKRDSVFSSESGLKYFVSGSFISSIFLFGCSLIYYVLGTLSLENINLLLSYSLTHDLNIVLYIGAIFILVTFFFKLGAVPFHFLYPDVYEGSPLSSTIILSILPQLALYFFLFKFLLAIGNNLPFLEVILNSCGILSLFIGTVYSINQKRIKRFVLYSSIAQTGFLLSCLSISSLSSFIALYFYLIVYLITSLLIWNFLSFFYLYQFSYNDFIQNLNKPLFISSLSNFCKWNKIWSFSFLIVLFSIGGIPIFGGFISKLIVFFELISVNYFLTAFLLIFISSLSVFYYIRIIKIIFFEPIIKSRIDFIFIYSLNNHLNLILFAVLIYFIVFLFFLTDIFYLFLNSYLFF